MLVPEFEYRTKGIWWHAFIGVEAILLIVLGYMTSNYTFSALMFVIWIVLEMRAARKPNLITLLVDGTGISLSHKKWNYKDIESYSIYEEGNRSFLTFTPVGKFQLPIKIPIKESAKIRARLNNLIKEVEYEVSILDTLGKFLKI